MFLENSIIFFLVVFNLFIDVYILVISIFLVFKWFKKY